MAATRILLMSLTGSICIIFANTLIGQQEKENAVRRPAFEVEMTITASNFPENFRPYWIEDVEVDAKENIFFLDNKRCQVTKLDAQGKFLLGFGKYGNSDGEFIRPSDLIINSKDVVYVADGPLKRVSRFTSDGRFLGSFSSALRYPNNMELSGVVGPEDQLIFAGSKDGEIFHVYDSSGIPLRSFGEPLTPSVPPKSRFEEMFHSKYDLLFQRLPVCHSSIPIRNTQV